MENETRELTEQSNKSIRKIKLNIDADEMAAEVVNKFNKRMKEENKKMDEAGVIPLTTHIRMMKARIQKLEEKNKKYQKIIFGTLFISITSIVICFLLGCVQYAL